jgi:transcription-repair coupling factor (superfamily II helicase)
VFSEGIIREAIEREMHRGGQVFFVHNRIQDIYRIEKKLKRLVPLARIAVAHGQMPERELEKIMLSFLDMEVDVLLATAIVGSGLDIPTANTIIINMAERMGLADLYQLKGRVGRSTVRGYSYYLIPGSEVITEEARRRLQAIQEMSYMGAGFRLAMKDLEIRGAGNLLGTQQSGNIKAVGFDLYIEMLEAAVAELRGIELKEKVRPEINIRVNAFISEDYVEDMILRLSTYRRISSASSLDDLKDIEEEMKDRFGPPPEPFGNLLKVMELKIHAEELRIRAVKQVNGHIRFTMSKDAHYPAEDLLKLFGGRVKFHTEGFELSLEEDVCQDIKSVLESLRGL